MQTTSAGSSISRFMRWAEEKIAQAVEEDERFIKKSGSADFLKSDIARPCSRQLNKSEKLDILARINSDRGNGIKVGDACESARIHYSTYVKWMKSFNLKYKKLYPKGTR